MEYIKNYNKDLYDYIEDLKEKRRKKNKKILRKLGLKLNRVKIKNVPQIDKDLIVQYGLDFMKINKSEFENISKQAFEDLNKMKKYNNQNETDIFWQEEVDKQWLCLNMTVQTEYYNEIYSYICKKFKNRPINFCDYGCGSGALSLAIKEKINLEQLHLYDVENYISKFVKEVIISNKMNNVKWYNVLEKNEEKYDFIMCNDVIEHLENSSEIVKELHNKLNDGGYLSLRIAFEVEDNTHLPQASEDFFLKNNGYEFLNNNFKLVYEYDKAKGLIVNGVYKKK